ncbi:MAG: hypothetical protein L6Q75_07740 [Burkholderiaceae bacterium]|nr:hypothetical protein [Burkholderiaceae bacterium]
MSHSETRDVKGRGLRPEDAALQLLAHVLAANGRVDACEVAELDRLGAWARLGIARDRLLRRAQRLAGLGGQLLRASRAGLRGLPERLASRLHAIEAPADRLLLCRLALATVRADGRVSADERLVLDTLLHGWRISPMLVAHANLRSPLG